MTSDRTASAPPPEGPAEIEGAEKAEAARAAVTFSLRVKLGLLAALLATVPVGLVGVVLIQVTRVEIATNSRELQGTIAGDVARSLEEEAIRTQDTLDAIGRVLSDPNVDAQAALAMVYAMVEASSVLDEVVIYDAEGRRIDIVYETGLRQIQVPEQLDQETMGEASARNLSTGAAVLQPGGPRIPLVVPLRARGRLTGFVGGYLSLEDVQARIDRFAGTRYADVSDSIFVVDERLQIIAHVDRRRAERLESAADEGILRTFSSQRVGDVVFTQSGEFEDTDGTPMVGSTARLDGRPWIVVVQLPTRVAYASLRQMQLIVVVVVLVFILTALIVGILLARRITAPLSQLTAFASDLAARRFDKRVVINTRDELSLLGGALSRAAEELEVGEERLRQEVAIRSDLGRYLSAELVEKVVNREQDMSLGGARREVTVLFADVVGFTPLTERLQAEEVVTILNELFTILTGIVFRHQGTVDKFIGDCVMAIWGAPTELEDHAERALSAAEDMLRWLEMGNVTWQERFGVTVRLAIGVHTGEVVVGNIGSSNRMEYTAIGDAVNVAARLESIARPQQILLSEATKVAAGEGFDYADAGEHSLSGRVESVRLYELRV